MVDNLKSILHGFLIGIANIIPGVSGGSMALALGIYERLIAAVGQFGGTVGRLGDALTRVKQKFAAEWRKIDGAFLSWIAVGGAVAVVVFSRAWCGCKVITVTYGFLA